MPETRRQVFKIFIEAPIQVVWDALTKEGEVLPFFFGSVMHTTGLKPGAPIRMRTPDGKYTGVVGEVLEFDPPHRYSMTFKFTTLNDPPCVVTHEIKEVDGGVEYSLITDKMPAGTKTEKQMTQGADFIVKTFKAVVENKPLPFMSRFILTMVRLSKPFTPKACLSTNWPLDKKIE